MKLVILSDTHGKHNAVKVPECDVLIHAGDCTNNEGRASLSNFLRWFALQPAKHRILIAGNHDGAFEKWPDLAKGMTQELCPGIHYLQDSGCEIDGVKFWGSPVSPSFCNWYFNRDPGEAIRRHWDMIPGDTDVLVTHGPPFSILDVSGYDNEKCGCRDLYEAMQRVKPLVHCFGHIHNSYGTIDFIHDDGWKTVCINAAICDEAYKPTRSPWIYELNNATPPSSV